MSSADSFFWIGSTHDVCEDYALNTMFRGQPMVAVFDGCSCSLLDCEKFWNHKDFEFLLMSTASHLRLLMGLDEDALDSTMIVATPNEVRMYGDGSVVLEYEDSSLDIITAEYSNNAPRYLNYLLDPERFKSYKEMFEGKLSVDVLNIGSEGSITEYDIFPHSSSVEDKKGLLKVEIPTNPDKKIKNITVLSDGISSFVREVETETSRVEEPVPTYGAVLRLLAFHNYNGVFAKRRAKRFIKDSRKWKWQNTDDVSMGVIHL